MSNVNIEGLLRWCAVYQGLGYGYSQVYRTMQTVNGVTFFDCSSYAFFALWLGGSVDVGGLGYDTDLSHYTSVPNEAFAPALYGVEDMCRLLGAAQIDTLSMLRNGDLLVRADEHCEWVFDAERLLQVGARNSSLPAGEQVAIHALYPGYYDYIWRFEGSPPARPIPPWLLAAWDHQRRRRRGGRW